MLKNLLFPLALLSAGLSLVLMVGCATATKEEKVVSDARTFSVVATAYPSFKPKADQKFIWYKEKMVVADAEASVQVNDKNIAYIENRIEKELWMKGYHMTTNSEEADYILGSALLLDHSDRSTEILDFVKVFPSLTDTFGNYEQGTLLVVIAKKEGMREDNLLWRGAIKAYVMGETLPPEARQKRLQHLIQRLIKPVPVGANR